jgi:hypothetical protein
VERLIDNNFFVIPDPGISAGSDCEITLFRVIVVDLKEKIPGFAFFDQEGVRYKLGMHIFDILRSKQGVYPALKLIELKRGIAAVNSDGPLFPSRNKRETASRPYISPAGKAEEQTGEDKEYRFPRKFSHAII